MGANQPQSDMPQCTLKIDAGSNAAVKGQNAEIHVCDCSCEPLLHNALNEVDSPITLKTEPLAQLAREGRGLNKEEDERVRALSLEGLPIPPAAKKLADHGLSRSSHAF